MEECGLEISEHGRVTRATAFAALFAAALMLVPSLMIGNQNLGPAENASAAFSDRILRIGWADYFGNINTLNPIVMTMGQEYMLVYPCYSELLTRDQNGELIGDLATKWTVSPDGKDWHFWITHTASFYDKNKPTVQMPLTVDDVMYAFDIAQTGQGGFGYYFPKDPVTNAPLISSYTRVNDYEMIFHLRESFGPFMSALTGVPIVPKYIWEGKNYQWANYDSKYPPCVGSGMYYYNRDNIADIKTMGASMVLNPTYFGIAERGWMPRVYEWRVYSESKATALGNFQKGNYDILIAPNPAEYKTVTEGGANKVKKFQSSQGFVLNFCANQLTPETRRKYGMDAHGDWNNQLLQDPIVKRALKMSVNRTAVVEFSLDGGGSVADSLMPKASPWYYHYGSDPANETPGMYIPDDGDRVGARQLLLDNGWYYNSAGTDLLASSDPNDEYTTVPLCKANGADKLEFRVVYCDWYDFIIDEGTRCQAWAAEAGINLVGGPASSATMNMEWWTGDWDIMLWDWWFNPLSEPSLDVCYEYVTDSIRNNSYASDYWPWVDEWYYASLRTSDYNERKELINKIQRYAYENSGEWVVAWRDNLYLAQTVQGGKGWTNWGDWVAHYTQCPDSNYWWLFMNIYPEDNSPPNISPFSVNPTDTTTPITYTVTVSGTNEYKWIFGDGTTTSWSPSYNVVKTFADDGYYEARLVARELDGEDHFVSFAKQTVTVINLTNQLPNVLAWTPSLGDPTAGEIVSFTGSATDVDDPQDRLSYSWDFGGGSIGLGKTASHRFGAPGIYSVKCRVDDGHLGTNPRPATRNQDLQVFANAQPHVKVGDFTGVGNARPYNFTLTDWGDPDTRDILKYTWNWGDDEPNDVTYTPYATHIYKSWQLSPYTLTVWADDQTLITSPSHNVSDSSLVEVIKSTGNAQPSMTSYGVSTTTPWNGSVVTFWANATDGDGDYVWFNFTFGDGTYAEVRQSVPNASVSVTHVYTMTGTFITRITYTDLIANTKQVFPPVVAPHGAYFNLHLDEGWNFVSVPLLNYGYMASTLGLAPGDEIVAFDPAKQDYDTPYVEGWPIGNFAINGSTGYWLYSGNYKTVRLFGDAPTAQQSRTITVPGGGGWVMIAVDWWENPVNASDIPGLFSGGSVTEIACYDPQIPGGYGIYIPGWPFPDFELLPGKAYWIWCTASGTLSYLP